MSAVELISLYSTLFYVSAALCALGFVCAVLFFFVFDIRKVYTQMTGRGKEQLRKREQKSKAASAPQERRAAVGVKSGDLYSEGLSAAPAAEDASQETTLLGTEKSSEEEQTAILYEKPEEEPAPAAPVGRFTLTENIVEIHTDEFI